MVYDSATAPCHTPPPPRRPNRADYSDGEGVAEELEVSLEQFSPVQRGLEQLS
jgi:hypothetical protein